MNEPKPIFDGVDARTEEEAIQDAEAAVDAGKLVPHSRVVEWLRSWGKSNELPCPSAE